jgi:hypothetical protein
MAEPMPAGDQIQVTPGDLAAHAARIEGVADRVSTAQQAGAAVGMGADAYGELCTVVPALLGALQDRIVDGIAAAAGSLHDTGRRLRTAAGGYQATDQHAAAAHDRIRNAL